MTLNIDSLRLKHLQTGSCITPCQVGPDKYFLTETFPNDPSQPAKRYFLQCVRNEGAAEELKSKYASMRRLAELIPSSVPEPIEWSRGQGCYSLLSHLIDESTFREGRRLVRERLCDLLAQLHSRSRDKNASFGPFHFDGQTGAAMTKSWTRCLQNLLETAIIDDNDNNGVYERCPEDTRQRFLRTVVPKLIAPIENEVIPCVIHGNLTRDTIKSDMQGRIFLFGPRALYAHDEMEFGIFRCKFSGLNLGYIDSYYHWEGRGPSNDWKDRNIMYSVFYNLRYSARFGRKEEAMDARKE